MLEEHVAYYLEKYLGNYVKGLSKEALKISAWQGNVELTNMQLKPEALNALKLPIKVKAGFLGSVKLKVPWSKLGKEPVIVLLDRIFVLVEPQTNVEYSGNDASMQEAKKRKIKEAELAMLDANFLQTDKAEVNNSWLGSLISTIIGNLKLSITNIHIRYEDSESNPGHPFAIGLTLKKLAAVTVDQDGKETFISSGPLDRIQKAGELQGLALYLDPDTKSWDPEKPWEKLSPTEWSKMFEPGIEVQSGNNSISNGASTPKCHYLLQPVGASARYTKLGSGDARTAEKEIQKAVLRLHDVTLSFSQAQYRDVLKLAENFSTFKKRLQYTHYRPTGTVKDDRKAWWKYAYRVTVEQLKKASGRLSWDQIVRFTRLRKEYLLLYINCLQSNPILTTCDENKEIQELDRDLDVDVAVQWRMLAHSYVDKSRKDENNRKQQSRGGWWSFLWGNQSSDNSNEPRSLTEEDWKQLNQVIGYQEGNESSPDQDPPDMLHTVLEVHMQHNATKLVDENCGNIIELSAEELQCNAKFYKEMKLFDFELGSYQLSSPEGLLAESEAQQKAIGGEFIYMPLNKSVDWSLSAKASPCYITYFKSSIDEVVNFFQNSDAVSQAVALGTAAALQATLDEVARSAQQQLNEALKQKPRFSLYLDIAAPKIIVPSEFYPDGKQQSKLLLDLGYLTLQTEELSATESQEEIELYMRFKLGLTDVQIFLVDGEFDWREHYHVSSGNPGKLKFHDSSSYLPVLERCGITLALQQICVPHLGYPATRLAVRLPSLGFHFSPARYHRLMHILKVFQSSSSDELENSIRPWDPADFEGEVSVLGWKGVGNREAVWQRRYAALAGPFLYILDSPSSSSSRRRTSFFGKQVLLVPPESIGGVLNVVVLCDAGQFNSKVAESVNTLLLRFDSEESREIWQGRLQGAIYRSSAPAAISGIFVSPNEHDSDKKDEPVESHENPIPNAVEKENFFLTGALDELKIVISSGPMGGKKSKEHLLLAMENPLLELRAVGSKVEFVMREFDMSIGAVLQALEIEDKYSGRGISERRYLACSDLDFSKNFKGGDNIDRQRDEKAPKIGKQMPKDGKDKKEMFFDTEEDLGETETGDEQLVQRRHFSRSFSVFYDAEDFAPAELLSGKDPPKFERIPFLLPDIKDPRKEEWPKDKIQENFVKAQIILFSLDSPAYKNVDKQITLSLATLSFFCIRPTIMALLNFTDAITADVTAGKEASSSDKDEVVMSVDSATLNDSGESKLTFDRKDSVIKGLLGSGKERTLFLLELNMRQAVITLNTENGGQIASLAQEDLSCKIKVFPSSFAVSASLGNLRISDSTVDREHPYSFICNTRNPGSTSFIELEFSSFNKDDDDYEGYEYSVVGKLSEIRFVYLNRFIQEISAYFMGLAPRNPGYIVKIDNKVTDVEKFFTQSEVEGSPAIKLDVSLTKPILLMPRETNSRDFLELDVLHIKVTNTLKWIGGEHDNPGAVRLDTTVLHVEDIHLSVGMNGKSGEGIIKKANGLSLIVTRSLRDLWHQVPGVDASIKIEELKADLSDKEYQVITECALSNLAEKANLPPPVLLPDSDGNEEHREWKNEPDLYVTESKTQGRRDTSINENVDANANAGSWTTIIVTAEIDLVELSLFKGTAREQALATAQVSGMWVAYKVNSIEESYIMASLKSLSVKDDREGTEPVLQYMIGKADDMEYHVENKSSSKATVCGSFGHIDRCSPLTMLVMDAKLCSTNQMISLRIQQPKLLVAVDFLLAIAEFFVPSLHTMVSDLKDTDEDPLNFKDGFYLDQPFFRQQGKENAFSPKRPLVVDNFLIDDYVYDGQGGSIRLQNENGTDLDGLPGEPLIFIGSGKHLRFKNVVIQSGDFLHSCIFLGVNSSYTILEADGVFLTDVSTDESVHSDGETDDKRTLQTKESLVKELMFDLQAIGPELTFYDSMSGHMMPQVAEKLIRAKMDVFSRFVLRGGDMELNAKINGLSVKASSGLNVVEPVDAEVKYSSVSGKQDVHITLSDILTNFSFSVLQLVLRLQEDISSFLRITTKQTTVQCYQFDKIWTDKASSIEQQITFWRPRVPPGFAVLGDCVTPLDEPLAKGVLALNMSLAWFKRPTSFEKVWSSGQSDSSTGCSAWMPIPPPGYVAFGCVVTLGIEPPPLTSVVCMMERVVTSSSLKDCIIVPGSKIDDANARGAFWRVDNSVGSFFVAHGIKESTKPKPFELLHVTISQGFPTVQDTNPNMVHGIPTSGDIVGEEYTANNTGQAQSNTSGPLVNGHLCETVAGFKLVWWNKNDNATCRISIWRPILPPGCAFVGDLAVGGYEPPSVGLVLRNQHDDVLLRKPLYFEETGHMRKHRALNEVFFWFPVAPPGYAALGCIATESDDLDPDLVPSFRCIRNDLVVLAQYGNKLWDNVKTRHTNEVLSIWSVENKIGTFIARKGLKVPPRKLAFCLADLDKDCEPDNLVVDAELKTVSAVIYDDFRGLMIPLLNLSLSGVNASSHGRMDALCSTLNFSLTALTYNGKCYAWEPLIEQFDGVVRHNYKSTSSHVASGTSSQLRVVSNSTVNINVSVTNLNMLLEAYASWNTLSKLMEISKPDATAGKAHVGEQKKPALEFRHKKSFQVIHHNRLGEDLLIRCIDINGQPKVVPLPSGSSTSIHFPTSSSILDRSLKGNIKRSSVKIVTILLGSAELLHDGGFREQKYMATVRIFPQLQTSDRHQLDQQSARTRCVSPMTVSDSGYSLVRWDEVFACEMETKESSTTEIMVTELATGSTVGYCSFPLSADNDRPSSNAEKKGDSRPVCMFDMKWEPLRLPQGCKGKEHDGSCGKISYGVYAFPTANEEETNHSETGVTSGLRPGRIQVSYKTKECWRDIGLNYAASATCWHLGQDTIATETILDDANRQLTFRSLVVVMNAVDFPLEVALSVKSTGAKVSSLDRGDLDRNSFKNSIVDGNKDSLMTKHLNILDDSESPHQSLCTTDEVFENERYQPLLGWGSTWPGHFLPADPRHWSRHDYSCSVQEFPGALLPLGWEWIDNWKVDKVGAADEDGWSYAFDFKKDWPPENNSKGSTKFVRRRRWIRSRKCMDMSDTTPLTIGTLKPQESTSLPVASLRSNSPDYSLQFRPHETNGDGHNVFRWSDVVLCKGHTEPRWKQQSLPEVSLQSLMEAEELLCSSKEEGSSSEQAKSLWFVVDVKARERGINSQLDPLRDWQIAVVAPLILYNYLPVSSEYTVLEKCSGSGFFLREKGVIEPGQEAHLYYADIRQALYLTWIPQGGWQPEDVPVLISHPFKQAARHISLKNFSTGRLLHVLVDHCSDGKDSVAKRIRFYVPCWLDVKKVPPLHCSFMDLKDRNKLQICLEPKASSHIKVLEMIQHEEMDGPYTMVSNFNLEKMGVSAALAETEKACFQPPTSLHPLSQADGYVELRALDETGLSYYKILASTKLCPFQSIPTKVLLLRPYITFTNRLGEAIYMKQTSADEPKTLEPFDWRVTFPLPATEEPESLQVRLDDTHWSLPFIVTQEETLHISMRKASSQHHIMVEVRGYEEGSRFLVVFRKGCSYGPYRLENRMRDTELQYRQRGLSDEAWQFLQPCSSNLYVWENPHGEQLLEVLIVKNSISTSEVYDINRTGNHYPKGLSISFYCEVLEVGNVKVVKFQESNSRRLQTAHLEEGGSPAGESSVSRPAGAFKLLSVDTDGSSSSSQMEIQLELGRFGISFIDLKLREILYLCMEKVSFTYATGYAGKARWIKLLLGYLQLDNQLPLTILPVVLVPEEKHDLIDPVLKISVIISDQKSEATEVYPYIGVQVTRSAWRINIHEPIIWAILDFYNDLHLDKISGGSDVGQVDPEVRIDLIDISETRLKLTLETAPRQRRRGLLGMWSPIVSALGNTSKMPIHLRSVIHRNRYIRKSAIVPAIVDRLRRDLIHNPLMLLSGVDVLGMTSSTLATLSETVAELSSDGKFLQLRWKLDRSRRIGGVSDGLVQGTEAIAQGVAFGLSGVIRRPMEKAKEKGFLGFFQGLGKAAVGIVMEPMSGVIDFVSLTVNGVGASCTRCFELFEQKPSFDRIRLPRFIQPNGVLCCYYEKAAMGQFILQLAEGRGRFHQGIFFREPSKFAWSDFYEDHFDIISHKIVMITNKRVMLLQRPKSHQGARVPLEPSFIMWDVPWAQMLALEMACSANDQAPIYAVLHLRNLPTTFAHLIKCSSRNSEDGLTQAKTVLGSISKAWKAYGPARRTILQQMGTKRQHRISSIPSTSKWPVQLGSAVIECAESQTESLHGSSSQSSSSEVQRQQKEDMMEIFNFVQIWTSEQVAGVPFCVGMISSKDNVITIWRPIVPEGYVSIGDIAHIGKHPPLVSISYWNKGQLFTHPTGFDLVWRSWKERFVDPVSIWMPRAPDGYTALGCVTMAAFLEPEVDDVWCAHSSLVEDANFEEQEIWHAPNNSGWGCFLYQVASEALTFMAVRQAQQKTHIKPKKVVYR